MKQIICLQEFNDYSGNYETSAEIDRLKMQFIQSATEIVEEYLGYLLVADTYHEFQTGTGSRKLYLNNRPIEMINLLMVDGKMLDFQDFAWNPEYVYMRCGIFPQGCNVEIDYSTGFNLIPSIIKTTILRIATLLLTEMGENIAVTSKSFADGSRQFVNYTSFDRYLTPLKKYRRFAL